MSEKRTVRGLLDYSEAVASGQEWEFEEPSPAYVPGLGLGTTDDARRWAWLGYMTEKRTRIDSLLKPKRGRPRKPPIGSKDAWRAFRLWMVAREFSESERAALTNRQLIQVVTAVEDYMNVPNGLRAFPKAGSHEQSVSRGKKALGIDSHWNSAVCEKIVAS